jgi:hypothetical protein
MVYSNYHSPAVAAAIRKIIIKANDWSTVSFKAGILIRLPEGYQAKNSAILKRK